MKRFTRTLAMGAALWMPGCLEENPDFKETLGPPTETTFMVEEGVVPTDGTEAGSTVSPSTSSSDAGTNGSGTAAGSTSASASGSSAAASETGEGASSSETAEGASETAGASSSGESSGAT